MVGERLVAYRRINGMSQQQLADAMDISRQTVVRWEKNTNIPSDRELDKLSLLLGISKEDLLSDDKEKAQFDENKQDEEAIVKQLAEFNSILADREGRKWKILRRIMVVAGILIILYVVFKIIRGIVLSF